jgi:hypothetical protein
MKYKKQSPKANKRKAQPKKGKKKRWLVKEDKFFKIQAS